MEYLPKRLKQLLKDNNWTIYHLSKVSGVPLSTLNHIINGETSPLLLTVQRICHGLNMTLAEFFSEQSFNSLSPDETKIITLYRTLSIQDKKLVLGYFYGFAQKNLKELYYDDTTTKDNSQNIL